MNQKTKINLVLENPQRECWKFYSILKFKTLTTSKKKWKRLASKTINSNPKKTIKPKNSQWIINSSLSLRQLLSKNPYMTLEIEETFDLKKSSKWNKNQTSVIRMPSKDHKELLKEKPKKPTVKKVESYLQQYLQSRNQFFHPNLMLIQTTCKIHGSIME